MVARGSVLAEIAREFGHARSPGRRAKALRTGIDVDGIEAFDSDGPPGAATDPVAVAKVAVEFAKTNEKFVLIGGALGAQTLDADGIKALAELPSLDVLRAGLVGMISTPATRIAGVLQAPAGQLARVFGAYAKKDEALAEAA